MRVLFLGPYRENIAAYLKSRGEEVTFTDAPLQAGAEILDSKDFLISYGYRHILKKDLLNRFPKRIINLHISYLPWNRGADPNLWSFVDNTPKGVTIHYIDAGLDTGEILYQEEIECGPDDTLRTSYKRLTVAIEALFMKVWPEIRSGRATSFPQPAGGTYRRLKDRERVEHLLTKGWDTPVADLIGKGVPAIQEVR
ncbi:Formyl transferase domain protein [Candidatus Zixiibacteriota bacterium]|nr:Formyl transferase domain protein [candidate division Zixibacteria bacterium]